MTAPTHISFAAFIYLVILTSAGVALSFVNGLVMAFASLLPDIDTGGSRVGRLLPPLTRWLERRFGHRTLTHSVPFVAGLALIAIPIALYDGGLYTCLVLGYASHPLLDSCTVTGVRLLYPISHARCVFPMEITAPMRYRVRTGSREEAVLGVIFVLASIPAFFVAYQGYERFVRVTQGTIESAVRDYNEFSRTSEVWVECLAHDMITKERLEGRFLVAETLGPGTLLIVGPQERLLTLGREYQSDFVAERAVCYAGGKREWRVERESLAKHDSVSVAVMIGDTLSVGEVIAYVGPAATRGGDPERLSRDVERAKETEGRRRSTLEARLEKLTSKVSEDSAEVEMLTRAVKAGFAAEERLKAKEEELLERRREIGVLRGSGERESERVKGEIARLERERESSLVALARSSGKREIRAKKEGLFLGSVRRRGIREDEFIYRIR